MDPEFWRHKRVLVTGQTGFKGAWLALWLERLGAEVTGLALAPNTEPSLFELADVGRGCDSILGDIRDRGIASSAVERSGAEVVFHLAAQSLVRRSYREPLETLSTNVMGTAKVLEAARASSGVRAVVVVTTDKCYENLESDRGYHEDDRLGGHDPYAASKACAELVTAAYRRSYFADGATAVATARAGNVIGGGDWAEDRLIPDLLRAIATSTPVAIRNPAAVRPWQHVLEPLAGYLELARALWDEGERAARAWNFGPGEDDLMTVEEVVDHLTRSWGEGARWRLDEGEHPHETRFLRLDSSAARARLGWRPRLTTREALDWTLDWHRAHLAGDDMREASLRQIAEYETLTGTGAGAGA